MRELAVVLLLVTGCAGPAWEAEEAPPPPLAPAQESVSGEVVLPGEGEPGSEPSAEPTAEPSAEPSSDGVADSLGDVCAEDSSETCQAFDAKAVCQYTCAAVAGESCGMMALACLGADVVTIGSLTIPCGVVIVAACLGGAACLAAC